MNSFGRTPAVSLDHFATFGDLLKYLRRRADLTQLELSIAVGYSDSMISRLEQNQRLPDLATIKARFIPVLGMEDEPDVAGRLLDLGANVRRENAPADGLPP
jgi:DNA-binding XRE family transcriptional regulator